MKKTIDFQVEISIRGAGNSSIDTSDGRCGSSGEKKNVERYCDSSFSLKASTCTPVGRRLQQEISNQKLSQSWDFFLCCHLEFYFRSSHNDHLPRL